MCLVLPKAIGRLLHFLVHGFSASNLGSVVDALNHHAIEFELRRLEDVQIWQLFCHDPDGAKVELDFPAREPAPKKLSVADVKVYFLLTKIQKKYFTF